MTLFLLFSLNDVCLKFIIIARPTVLSTLSNVQTNIFFWSHVHSMTMDILYISIHLIMWCYVEATAVYSFEAREVKVGLRMTQ